MEGQVLDSGSGNGLIAERAYHELRDRIVTLQLPPGAILREDELMRELGSAARRCARRSSASRSRTSSRCSRAAGPS